jgi:hypothetical protein
MNNEHFTKLFNYVEQRFGDIEKKLDQKASQDSMDRLINTLDGFL